MSQLLSQENLFLNQSFESKEELLDFVASSAQQQGITKDAKKLYQDFLDRESEFSTGLQDGFAIPHARSENVDKVAVFFIRNTKAIDWETMDDSKVTCAFALMVPKENESNIHLQMISTLATNLLEDDFKAKIKETNNVNELHEYILSQLKV